MSAGRKWLHTRLEGFRIDKDLVGRDTGSDRCRRHCGRSFATAKISPAATRLTEATVAALDASAALIVLCSPVAASRPAVNEEVRLFRSRHPDRPVIPVIADGTCARQFSAGAAL